MYLKLVLVLVMVAKLAQTNGGDFTVVSTSERPSQNSLVNETLTKLEEMTLQLYVKVAETNRRIEALEIQNRNLDIKVTANNHKLEEMELNNVQTQIKLQNIDSALTKLADQFQPTHFTESFPKNCKEVKERGGNVSHIYRIKPDLAPEAFLVLCNMETKGGGWTYVLNRFDGSQDFYLNWTDYKNGFGNLARESWLGLEHLYQLTGNEVNELLIELVDHNEKKVYAHYTVFSIGSESEGYPLKLVAGYSGDAGESFDQHIGMKFQTKDNESKGKCATTYSCQTDFFREFTFTFNFTAGAWWYTGCYFSQLTGSYLKGNLSESANGKGIHWNTFHGYNYSLNQARMMIKPTDFRSHKAFVPQEIKH